MMHRWIQKSLQGIGILLGLLVLTGCQEDTPPKFPTGVYCSCPITSTSSRSVLKEAGELDYVDGILVRVLWDDLNPADGVFDWSLLDEQIDLANGYGKKIALAVVAGPHSPTWLYDASAQNITFEFLGKNERTMPIPWDPVFLDRWSQFITALGERYNSNATITLVHMTSATTNGFEMQINMDSAGWDELYALGFSHELLVDSWKQVLDAYHVAFPDKPLDVEVHPIGRDPTVAQQVAEYGYQTMGRKFGVFGAWWTLHNATNVYTFMYDLLNNASEQSFSSVQFAAQYVSFKDDAEYFNTITLAYDIGVRYMEIWKADLVNEDLQASLADLANNIAQQEQEVVVP